MTTEETDRRQKILDAAMAEFAAKGFTGATIKSIARAAGLSAPSLIYWYFPTKEELFQAVLQAHSPFFQAVFDPAPLMDRPPEEVLLFLARSYMALIGQDAIPQMWRLLISEIVRRPEIADMIASKFMARVLEFLRHYLEQQIQLGRLRPHDTRTSAKTFMGMLIPHVLSLILLPSLRQDQVTSEEYVETAVAIFLTGLQPATSS